MKIGSRCANCHRNPRHLALIALSAVALSCSVVESSRADVESVRWIGTGVEQGIQIELENEADFKLESLDDGRRIRISLDEVNLNRDVADIPGRGRTIGVFPFVALNEKAVYVDVLFDAPGELVVIKNAEGLLLLPPDSSQSKNSNGRVAPIANADVERMPPVEAPLIEGEYIADNAIAPKPAGKTTGVRDAGRASTVADTKKVSDAKKAAEAKKVADAKKAAEAKTVADAKKAADAKTVADAKKAAETKKVADAKKAAEAKKVADAKKAAEAKTVADAKKAVEAKTVADAKKAAEAKTVADAKKAVEAKKIADAKKAAEAKKIAEAKKAAKAKKVADAKKAADAKKMADAKKAADAKKMADAKKAADAKKLADAKKAAEAKKVADAKKAAEAKQVADAKKAAEAKTVADAKKAAEAKRVADAKKAAEAKTVADADKAADAGNFSVAISTRNKEPKADVSTRTVLAESAPLAPLPAQVTATPTPNVENVANAPVLTTDGGPLTTAPVVVAATDAVRSAAATMRATAVTMVAADSSAVSDGGLSITNIRYSPLPGGRVQVDLEMDGRPAEPGTFITNKPPRMALDFFGASIGFEKRNIKIDSGPLESIIAIQTKDRVRIVFNLVRTVGYETEVRDNGIAIILESPEGEDVSQSTLESRMFPEKSENPAKHSINKIDFRRDKDGGGKIIVELSDPKAGVDVKEKSGEMVVDFIDTSLSPDLEQRLDVVDFATPVQTIDTFRQGAHTRMVITPDGRYRQQAYQSGNVFSLTISPLSVQELEEEKLDEFGYSGEKLSLNFQKISVRAALQVIADFTGLNFVTSDAVKGSLTLRLQDVPWDQSLDIILQTKGLAMRQKGNVVWVAPAQEIAAKERQQLEASRQVAELEPLASELIQINYAKAEDIADLLKSIEPVRTGVETGAFGSVSIDNVETESNTLLSTRGQVTVDGRTNSLLIQDTPTKIREVRKLIARLDRPVRQVLIETRIVEASDTFSRVLGARLGFARQSENTRFPGSRGSNLGTVTMSGNVEDVTTINNDGFTTVNTDGLSVNLPARGIGAEAAGSFAISVEKVASGMWNLLNLELSALEASGDGKIIASPKIMTANQQEAIIKQGQERVFPPSGFNTKPTRDEAVLLLQVKPQITPDDRLVLDVRIKQDVFVDTTINVKDKKEVQTQVLLENGETVVIGGIYQEQTRTDISKIPLLGDLPFLGHMFKRKGSDNQRKELLVFLTPRILDNSVSFR